jgi:hypothetical protein
MTKDTFREALSITLRVTALAGCTPSTTPVTVAPPTADLTDGGVLAQADPVPKPRVAPPPPETCPKGDFDCCLDLLHRATADGGYLPKTDPILACCDTALTQAEVKRNFAGEVWACCEHQGILKNHQRFCSPWGPPMPPAIVWLNDTMACQSYEWPHGPCVDTIQA